MNVQHKKDSHLLPRIISNRSIRIKARHRLYCISKWPHLTNTCSTVVRSSSCYDRIVSSRRSVLQHFCCALCACVPFRFPFRCVPPRSVHSQFTRAHLLLHTTDCCNRLLHCNLTVAVLDCATGESNRLWVCMCFVVVLLPFSTCFREHVHVCA